MPTSYTTSWDLTLLAHLGCEIVRFNEPLSCRIEIVYFVRVYAAGENFP